MALRHGPHLLVATALTFGGLMPFFNAEHAILEFGLPRRIATSQPAQAVMIVSSARITAIGLAIYAFHYQQMYSSVDILLACLGYVGLIDGYVCWKEGMPGRAVFRLTSGLLICAWGFFGVTAGQ